MEHKKEDKRQGPPEIKLPFEKKSEDPGLWAYDHRIGLCVTVIAYLVCAIIFVTGKILIARDDGIRGFYVDMQEFPEQQKPDPAIEMTQTQELDYSNVRNLTSNRNAREDQLNRNLRDAKGTDAGEIYNEADAVQDRIRANREAYEQGLRAEQDMINAGRNSQSDANAGPQNTKQRGRVTVSFSLVDPIRHSMYLHIPAYQCEGGGEVVVAVTVNRNGNVTSASVDRASTSDRCLLDMALEAARRSRFNVDTSAPERHQGTIEYIFIPQ